MEPEGLVLTGEQPTGATTDKVGKGTVPCSRTTPVPTTDFFSFLSKSQRSYIPTGQRDSILVVGLRVRAYLRLDSVWLLQRACISTATPVLLMALLWRLQAQDKVRLM